MPLQRTRVHQRIRHHLHRTGWHLKQHFIPHEGNGYHPHALRHKALLVYSSILVLLKVALLAVSIFLPASSLYSSAITPRNVMELTNYSRTNIGVAPLTESVALARAAQAKAEDMLRNQYFAHTSPAGATPWTWIAASGYVYAYAGENLAVHFTNSEELQNGWMASPSHKANIVNPRYSETGVGIANGMFEGAPTTFVVQYFARPYENPDVARESTLVSRASDEETQKPTSTTPSPPQALPGPAPKVAAAASKPAPAKLASPKKVAVVTSKSVPQPAVTPVAPTTTDARRTTYDARLTTHDLRRTTTEPPTPVQVTDADTAHLVYLRQTESAYDVHVTASNTRGVIVQLGNESAPLTETRKNEWKGSVPFNPLTITRGGEPLTVVTQAADGSVKSEAVALVAPHARVDQMYAFNAPRDRELKLFGFISIGNLQDSVRQFYVLAVIILVALLLINIFVKIEIQDHAVNAHALFVIVLAGLLVLI
jgi:hypothetical protein